MRLVVTPAVMERAYLLLVETPPFRRWKLPHPDEIVFRVTADPSEYGHFGITNDKARRPLVGLNQKLNLTLHAIVVHTAHEMCHLYQWKLKLPQNHGVVFTKLKMQVCRHHGFDPGTF